MQQLVGADTGDGTLLQEMFLQRLPDSIRMVIASSAKGKSVAELAQLADQIISDAPPSLAGVKTPQPQGEVEDLHTKIAKLQETVATLSTSHRHRRSPSPRWPPRQSSPPCSASTGICWYHAHFGKRARKCTQPCSFQGNNMAST